MCRSSHRADTPRPAGGSRPAGLGTTTARGLNLRGSILGSPFQELRLSRPVVRGVNWAAHRKNPVFAAGLSSGVFGLAGWQRGLRATGPRHSRVQATPTDRAASGAPKSVRSVQCESQAIAQNHQGPQRIGVLQALALLPRERLVPTAVSSGNDPRASIIAPGREGSQLRAPPPSWSPPKPLTAEEKANL